MSETGQTGHSTRAREIAAQLRTAGHSFRAIAEQLGLPNAAAARAEVLAALERSGDEPAEELRALELERLDELHAAVWTAAKGGDLDAVDRVLKIAARRAALVGLDAPKRLQAETTQTARVEVYLPAIDGEDGDAA